MQVSFLLEMINILKRRCKHPTCNELVSVTDKYCDKHKTTREQQYNYNRRRYDREYLNFYNSARWRRLREQILMQNHYICVRCGRQAEMVDHIVPTKVDWNRRLDPSNMQAMCWSCHNRKTEEDNKRYPKK